MATISVSVDEPTYERVAELARERETEPAGLIRAYLDYLAAGGSPLEAGDDLPVEGLQRLAELGGSFDWLKDEPNLYSAEDGEPYR